jgi:hypothetical protein
MRCHDCGGDRVRWFEDEVITGAVAPDGYQESHSVEGWQCLDCGSYDVAEEVEIESANLEEEVEVA